MPSIALHEVVAIDFVLDRLFCFKKVLTVEDLTIRAYGNRIFGNSTYTLSVRKERSRWRNLDFLDLALWAADGKAAFGCRPRGGALVA